MCPKDVHEEFTLATTTRRAEFSPFEMNVLFGVYVPSDALMVCVREQLFPIAARIRGHRSGTADDRIATIQFVGGST